VEGEIRVPIISDLSIVSARQKGRESAAQLGFSLTDQTIIASAISELARNILIYAKTGEIVLKQKDCEGKPCIVVESRDEGPGIPDVKRAMEKGFSTSGGLGLGLWGVQRLMDKFEIHSDVGRGTVIIITKVR
jgi:serine/threonine-protein kinase RsbT